MSTPTHARRGRPAPSRGSDPPAHAGTVAEVLNEIEAATDRRTRRAMLPERNLVAALITLDRDRAAEVLSLVTTADFEDHLSAVIAALIRVIACERGEPPVHKPCSHSPAVSAPSSPSSTSARTASHRSSPRSTPSGYRSPYGPAPAKSSKTPTAAA